MGNLEYWAILVIAGLLGDGRPAWPPVRLPGALSQQSRNVPAGTFVPGPVGPYFGGNPPLCVTGDFNGDGITDYAIADNDAATIQVMFGDGNGGFSAAPGAPFPVGSPSSLGSSLVMAAGDFNRDGKTDLAVVISPGTSTVLVLLSNGSGGFSTSFSRNLQLLEPGVALAADFNGDGNPDLAIGDNQNLTVLMGDGRGGLSLGTGGGSAFELLFQPTGMATADFNGDGKPDLAVVNHGGGTLGILLGDGFGGFSQASGSPYAVGGFPVNVATGDFNGDGKPDVVVTGSPLYILLNDGTGAFTKAPASPIGGGLDVASADFDGDGILDLAFAGGMTLTVCLGNGDGTFRSTDTFQLTDVSFAVKALQGDFNGDGRPDLAILDLSYASGYEVRVFLGAVAGTVTTLTATVPSAASPNTFRLQVTVNPAPSFTTAGGHVQFFDGNSLLSDAQAQSGLASTLVPLSSGQHVLSAIYQGDSRTLASTSNTLTLNIDSSPRAAQTITLFPISNQVFSSTAVSLNANSSSKSGIPIVFSVISGPAIIGGSQLTLTGTGTITLQASQDGNTLYQPATPVTTTFTVSAAPQTISLNTFSEVNYGNPPLRLVGTASSGLPLVFTVLSGPATLSGNVLAVTGVGTASIQATQAGNANYLAAPAVTFSLKIVQAQQTITFPGIPSHYASDGTFSINATASSGLPVTLSLSGPGTISGNVVTITGAGQITIQASQAGSADYLAAATVTQYVNIIGLGPYISGITNAAGYNIAPTGAYAAIFGNQLGSKTVLGSGSSPGEQLGGVSVTFTANDQSFPADLYYVSPQQINLIVPPTLPTGISTTITVNSPTGAASLTEPFGIGSLEPGIFTADGSGSGPPAGFAITVGPDGSTTTVPLFQCTTNPLKCVATPIPLEAAGTQVFLSLYATGVRNRNSLADVSATVGGVAATVTYAGPQGSFPALDQVNLLVDPFTGPRLVGVQVTVAGYGSNTVQVQFR